MSDSKKKTVPQVVVTYVVWLVLSAGIIVIVFAWRTAVVVALSEYASRGFFQGMRTSLIEKGYFIFGGGAALGVCIALEVSLARVIGWPLLAAKSLLVLGIECTLIGVATGVTQIFAGVFFTTSLHGLSFALPLVLGGICIAGSVALRRRDRARTTS